MIDITLPLPIKWFNNGFFNWISLAYWNDVFLFWWNNRYLYVWLVGNFFIIFDFFGFFENFFSFTEFSFNIFRLFKILKFNSGYSWVFFVNIFWHFKWKLFIILILLKTLVIHWSLFLRYDKLGESLHLWFLFNFFFLFILWFWLYQKNSQVL